MYGVGQGLGRGVGMVTNMFMDAMTRRSIEKRPYDELAVRQGWQDAYRESQPQESPSMVPAIDTAGPSATMGENRQIGRFTLP